MTPVEPITIGAPLTVEDIRSVSRNGARVCIAEHAKLRLRRTRQLLQQAIADGRVMYGVNTGLGALCETRIDNDALNELQVHTLRSHAAGVGDALPHDVVKALLLLRAHRGADL